MGEKYAKEDCIAILKSKSEALSKAGEKRYPTRSDFTPEQVVAIKSHLGPWPRALEAAGIKPVRSGTAHERTVQKRIKSKRNRRFGEKTEEKNEKP